jgi:HEPN domain-containing protein
MPPEASLRELAESWMAHARADLALVRMPLPPDSRYELLLFHAQQAVEKALKAVMIAYGIHFPHTHNLQRLVELLPQHWQREPELLEATSLTIYAVELRYPGDNQSPSRDEYLAHAAIAERALAWASARLDEQ